MTSDMTDSDKVLSILQQIAALQAQLPTPLIDSTHLTSNSSGLPPPSTPSSIPSTSSPSSIPRHTTTSLTAVPMNLRATHPRASHCQHSLNDSDLSARTSTTAVSENQDDDGDDDDEPLSLFLKGNEEEDNEGGVPVLRLRGGMARTKRTARKDTGGKKPRQQLATKASRGRDQVSSCNTTRTGSLQWMKHGRVCLYVLLLTCNFSVCVFRSLGRRS
jgi:hypothetical protein